MWNGLFPSPAPFLFDFFFFFSEMDGLKVFSLNAKGLNMLLHDLKASKTDITFIQETHFRENKVPVLKNRFFPEIYHATNKFAKARGVSILLSSKFSWVCSESLLDERGTLCVYKRVEYG